MAEYFGIRHFSPACAFYVTEFLDRVKPEYVLIEGAFDLSYMIEPLCSFESSMPVAMLAYTVNPPIRTVLWPFAEFSPEYQAMMWATENSIPVKFCDLPSSCFLAQLEENKEDNNSQDKKEKISVYEQMEKISGMDNDTFWEYAFEQSENYEDFLKAVEEYGKSLREFSENDENNKLREAFMRQLKELKLERFRSAKQEVLELDLRENLRVKSEKAAFLGLNRSFFMHRLKVLGIKFGEEVFRNQDNATWAELWSIQWSPEIEIEIVEASLNGDTVEQATQIILGLQLENAENLSETASILSKIFLCGLSDMIKSALANVQKMAVDCSSIKDIGDTISTLSYIVRFGGIRRIDVEPIIPLIQQLYLRFCLNVIGASVCDKNASEEIVSAISKVNDACLSHEFLDENDFISELDETDFKPVLVCLRRTFADFSPSEKCDIAENIGEVMGLSSETTAEFINAELNDDEKKIIDDLDDFDFGDI